MWDGKQGVIPGDNSQGGLILIGSLVKLSTWKMGIWTRVRDGACGTYPGVRNQTGRLDLDDALQEFDTADLDRAWERVHFPEDFLFDGVHCLPRLVIFRVVHTTTSALVSGMFITKALTRLP